MDVLADKNPMMNSGWTPLHSAAKNGHLEICKLIMEVLVDKLQYTGRAAFPACA